MTTTIGVMVINTALFMGVDSSSPLKKTNILITIPSMAQITILPQSLRSILSLGLKKEIPQNNTDAPETRNKINPKGLT